jgi:hypothetical protein
MAAIDNREDMIAICRLPVARMIVALGLVAGGSSAEGAQGPPATPPPAQAPPVKEVQPAESRLQFYGFIREDVILDDGRPDSTQSPLFIMPEAQRAGSTYTMHPRLTRFGFNLAGPEMASLAGARLTGKFEIDFQNGGRDSRAIPRYRHAYMSINWRSSSLLVGQTWDLISPLFPSVNADTLMWNAGNLGDRRPQIRATVTPATGRAQWSLAFAAGLTGAVDQLDLDTDGIRDGEAGGIPTLQGRVGVSYPLGTRRLVGGLWAHGSRQEVATPVAGETRFSSHAFGGDLEIPLGARGVFRGEAWSGSNLPDIRGGIGQGVNRATGAGIDSTGGWAEIGGDLVRWYGLSAGYTVDSPDADVVPAGGRTRNSAWYIANRLTAGRPFVVGLDYLRWRTEYRDAPSGTDNRINAYATYSF